MNSFEIFSAETNVSKCYFVSAILLFLNIGLIFIDKFIYKYRIADMPQYSIIYYAHIAIIISIILWIFYYKKAVHKSNYNSYKILYLSLVFFLLIWGMVLAFSTIYINKQISPYIIVTLALSVFLKLNKVEAFSILSSSNIIFTICLLYVIKDKSLLYDHLINISITNILAYLSLSLNYKYFKLDFYKTAELIKNKEELETANLELKKYDKTRTKLFTNISHELKTPINVIYGSQQLLDSQLNNNYNNIDIVKCRNYTKMIKQNSFRLIRLINNILDISKIEDTIYEIKPENTEIIQAVESIVSSVVDFVNDKGINIIFDTDLEEKIIAVDRDKLERILLNLISNAIKFTDSGGTIYVTISTTSENTFISVKDTGIGIDEASQLRIFDRFTQVDESLSRNTEGSGIGLALVKSLMQLHNGDVSLNSSPGNGSDFILRFPNKILTSNSNSSKLQYKNKSYKNKVERIEIEFSDIYK